MTASSLRIHPAALEEAEAAVDWYAQRSTRAAGMLLDELDRAIDRIGRNPEQYPVYDFGTRRTVMRRFPFLIFFRSAASGIEIIALAHARRRPYYWRERLG